MKLSQPDDGAVVLDMNELVLLDEQDTIFQLTLNRPERHNSLVPALLDELLAALEIIRMQSDMRSVILAANGPSFSTGGDVSAFYDHLGDLEAYANRIVGLLNQVILELIALPVPVVGAVHGIVTGGSLGLVLASDVVLVTPQASFTPYYNVVGFSPDGGWTALLPAIIGHKRVAETLSTNRTITAREAVTWGLANRLTTQKELQAEAFKTAQKIATMKPSSLQSSKRLLWNSLSDIAARLESERLQFVKQIGSLEARLGMAQFLGMNGQG